MSFTALPDLALRTLGGTVMAASDESFAAKENLLNPGRPAFQPHTFSAKGQEYDGWETRRRRSPGCPPRCGSNRRRPIADSACRGAASA